jgi:hypothetical protein
MQVPNIALVSFHGAKMQYRKFETNIPRKGIARPKSQFHILVSVRDIYSYDRYAYSAAGKYVDRTWEYVEIGTEAAQFPEKEYINGIFVAVHSVV